LKYTTKKGKRFVPHPFVVLKFLNLYHVNEHMVEFERFLLQERF
jgi:hypothetical protein